MMMNVLKHRYLLVADSGATKCSWALLRLLSSAGGGSAGGGDVLRFETAGLNAAVASAEDVVAFAKESAEQLCFVAGPEAIFPEEAVSLYDDSARERHSLLRDDVAEIWIYAAGAVSEEMTVEITRDFRIFFRNAEVKVCSDMLGAARAVCGDEPGIVGILGTGSNSCLYDGQQIAVQGLGGGYVLGDEGSGAWVGKHLLSDYIRGLLPAEMDEALRRDYALDYPTIVDKVYRSGTPGRYLASFFPLVLGYAGIGGERTSGDKSGERCLKSTPDCESKSAGTDKASREYARRLLREGFGAFLDRCILSRYDCAAYPLNLCGSVAWLCRDIISDCARERNIRIGRILKSPIDGLIKYHLKNVTVKEQR